MLLSLSGTKSRHPVLTLPPARAVDHAMGSVTSAGWDGEMGQLALSPPWCVWGSLPSLALH